MRLSDLYATSQMRVGLGLAENVPMVKQATHATVMSVRISLHWMDGLILTSAKPQRRQMFPLFSPSF